MKRNLEEKTRKSEIAYNMVSKNQKGIVMVKSLRQDFVRQQLRDALAEKESQIEVKLENTNSLKKALHKSEAFVIGTTETTISEKEVPCIEVKVNSATYGERNINAIPGHIK